MELFHVLGLSEPLSNCAFLIASTFSINVMIKRQVRCYLARCAVEALRLPSADQTTVANAGAAAGSGQEEEFDA